MALPREQGVYPPHETQVIIASALAKCINIQRLGSTLLRESNVQPFFPRGKHAMEDMPPPLITTVLTH